MEMIVLPLENDKITARLFFSTPCSYYECIWELNAICSYKAKGKNRTLVPEGEFEARIMKIKKNPEHHC